MGYYQTVTIQLLSPCSRASYHYTDFSAGHPLFCMRSNIRNMTCKFAAFFLFEFNSTWASLFIYTSSKFQTRYSKWVLIGRMSEIPDSITSELSLMSSFVGFNRVTKPCRRECWTSYFIRSLMSSQASYCTSRWRDRKSSSTGSTIVGLAVPTMGC